MTDLKRTIASGFTARYEKLEGVIHELGGSLSEVQFWAKPFAFGNSFGHLLLHLTGNLNYYIGAQIAGTDMCEIVRWSFPTWHGHPRKKY